MASISRTHLLTDYTLLEPLLEIFPPSGFLRHHLSNCFPREGHDPDPECDPGKLCGGVYSLGNQVNACRDLNLAGPRTLILTTAIPILSNLQSRYAPTISLLGNRPGKGFLNAFVLKSKNRSISLCRATEEVNLLMSSSHICWELNYVKYNRRKSGVCIGRNARRSIIHARLPGSQEISVAFGETPLLFLPVSFLVKRFKVSPESEDHDNG